MIYILTILLLALQLLDWYTTRTILGRGGVELNPVMRRLFMEFDVDAILGIKALVVAAAGAWIGAQQVDYIGSGLWVLGGLCAIYAAVVMYNMRSL